MKHVNDGPGRVLEHQCYHKVIVNNNHNRRSRHNDTDDPCYVHCKVKERETSPNGSTFSDSLHCYNGWTCKIKCVVYLWEKWKFLYKDLPNFITFCLSNYCCDTTQNTKQTVSQCFLRLPISPIISLSSASSTPPFQFGLIGLGNISLSKHHNLF